MGYTQINDLSIVAFIPARSGSKRIPHKNIMDLGGHPLIAYTISSAIRSRVFKTIIFVTDSMEYEEIARCYGIEEVYPQCPTDTKSEYESYIKWLIETMKEEGREYDCFCILRPTSPFRHPSTIKRALAEFLANQPIDSLRAVEPVKQHPGKMYSLMEGFIPQLIPLWDTTDCKTDLPMRDKQIQALPQTWIQNGSLEIAWMQTVYKYKSFSGEKIYPFRTQGWEGFDLNRPEDVVIANWLIQTGQAVLPKIVGEDEKKENRISKGKMVLDRQFSGSHV
jgi:N-acylneuraminate cytidylyltransferase